MMNFIGLEKSPSFLLLLSFSSSVEGLLLNVGRRRVVPGRLLVRHLGDDWDVAFPFGWKGGLGIEYEGRGSGRDLGESDGMEKEKKEKDLVEEMPEEESPLLLLVEAEEAAALPACEDGGGEGGDTEMAIVWGGHRLVAREGRSEIRSPWS